MKEIFSEEFWADIADRVINSIVQSGPTLVLILILYLISTRALRFIIRRIQKMIVSRIHKGDSKSMETEKRANTLFGIVNGILNVTLVSIFILITMRELGIDIGPILAGAGILGLAVGFGAQELVRDVISGFFILLENQIRTGDVAVINGTGGVVESIQLRTITLRDFSQTVHIFQNGKINSLSNMTMGWSAAVLDIGVAYKEDVDRVMEIMKSVGDDMKKDAEFGQKISEPMEMMGLDSFGDSAIVIKARIKTIPGEQWNVAREYRRRLKFIFDQQNIEIPFPHRTIYWGEESTPLKVNKES
jgi:small conductance mechanosensitive channel